MEEFIDSSRIFHKENYEPKDSSNILNEHPKNFYIDKKLSEPYSNYFSLVVLLYESYFNHLVLPCFKPMTKFHRIPIGYPLRY